jgi:hypothetical protein
MKVYIGPYKAKPNKERKVNIKIDSYDLWNMDRTLAMIIHPMLLKMKKDKHGSPAISDSDLPSDFVSQYPDGTGDDIHIRWEYVLDQMIFSFEHILDDKWESELMDKHDWPAKSRDIHEKIQNGLVLFGKYFTALWT